MLEIGEKLYQNLTRPQLQGVERDSHIATGRNVNAMSWRICRRTSSCVAYAFTSPSACARRIDGLSEMKAANSVSGSRESRTNCSNETVFEVGQYRGRVEVTTELRRFQRRLTEYRLIAFPTFVGREAVDKREHLLVFHKHVR